MYCTVTELKQKSKLSLMIGAQISYQLAKYFPPYLSIENIVALQEAVFI